MLIGALYHLRSRRTRPAAAATERFVARIFLTIRTIHVTPLQRPGTYEMKSKAKDADQSEVVIAPPAATAAYRFIANGSFPATYLFLNVDWRAASPMFSPYDESQLRNPSVLRAYIC